MRSVFHAEGSRRHGSRHIVKPVRMHCADSEFIRVLAAQIATVRVEVRKANEAAAMLVSQRWLVS